MLVTNDPAARRFGIEVRRLREQAGISQTRLAKLIPTSQTTVSDIELGKGNPKRDIAERLDALLTGEGRVIAAWETHFQSYEPPEWYRKLPVLEQRAVEIQEYQPLLVPGLVQIEDYAEASIWASNRAAPKDFVSAKVRERTDRQRILAGEDPPFVSVVLDETVLRRRLGAPDTMVRQLDYLRKLSTQNRAEVLVVPADTWNHPGLDNGFKLLRVPEAGMVLYQETRAGGGVVIDQEAVGEHAALMAELRGVALPPDQSRAAIERLQGELK